MHDAKAGRAEVLVTFQLGDRARGVVVLFGFLSKPMPLTQCGGLVAGDSIEARRRPRRGHQQGVLARWASFACFEARRVPGSGCANRVLERIRKVTIRHISCGSHVPRTPRRTRGSRIPRLSL